MPAELIHNDQDFKGNQIQNFVIQPLTADPAVPKAHQAWTRSDLPSGGGGNGVIRYADSALNILQLATGSSALSNAYSHFTDSAANVADASGSDTFKLRSGNTTYLTITVTNNEATHNDNALFNIVTSTTGAASSLVALDGSSNTALNTLKLNGPPTVGTQIGMISNNLGWHNGVGVRHAVSEENTHIITGRWTFNSDFILATVPSANTGAFGWSSGSLAPSFWNGTTTLVLASRTGTEIISNKTSGSDFNMGAFKITNLAAATNNDEAVNLSQLLNTALGTPWKANVRAVLTTNVNLSSPGSSLDGLTISGTDVNKRFLLAGQTTAAQNGVYDWNGAASAMSRSGDADTTTEIRGMFTAAEEGTEAGNIWNLITDNLTLGSTALTFQRLPGPQDVGAGAGMTKTGNILDVIANANGTIVVAANDVSTSVALASVHSAVTPGTGLGFLSHNAATTVAARTLTGTTNRLTVNNGDGASADPTFDISTAYAGQATIVIVGTIGTGVWQGTVVGLAYGGTGVDASAGAGAATARDITHLGRPATAPANATNVVATATGLLASAKFVFTGTGAATTFTLTHNLNNLAPIIGPLILASTGAREHAAVVATTANAVTVTFNTAPLNGVAYNMTIAG